MQPSGVQRVSDDSDRVLDGNAEAVELVHGFELRHRHVWILPESRSAVSKVSEALCGGFEPERRVVSAKAVYSRCVSAMKPHRVEEAKVFKPSNPKSTGDRQQ
jgi:hypothetical protein